jgi:hypothetical protein
MKPKTAFESGNSPPKISESGAPIMSGTGVAAVRKKLEEEFQKAREAVTPSEAVAQSEETIYSEKYQTRFNERAKRLSLAALSSSHIVTHNKKGVWNIEPPSESAEDLYRAALRREK